MTAFDPAALECLAAVLEEGGFERAAQRLAITQSAVSQRLRALEAQAGTVLVVRSRPVRPTRAGQLLLKHATMLRLLRADLEHELRELAPERARGAAQPERVAVAINADSIATWALDALQPLVQQGLALELITDDQDFTHDWLRQGQVMGCVTSLAQPLRGCRVEPLGEMAYVAVASQRYAAAHLPHGLVPQRLADVPVVAFNRKDDLPRDFLARAFGLRSVAPRLCFVPSAQAQVRAVQAGWGVAVLPRLLVHRLLEAGELVDVLPQHQQRVALYWHCWRLSSGVLDALTAALRHAARAQLLAPQLPQEG